MDPSQLLVKALREDAGAVRELGVMLDSLKHIYGLPPVVPLFYRTDALISRTAESLIIDGTLTKLGTVGNINITNDGAHLQFTRAGANYIHATTALGYLVFTVDGDADSDYALQLAANKEATFASSVKAVGLVRVERVGSGTTPGAYQRVEVVTSSGGDALTLGFTSSDYTTGGALGWVGNSQAFLYYSGGTFKIGEGSGSLPALVIDLGALTLSGYMQTPEIATPTVPPSGSMRWYADSTYSWPMVKNDIDTNGTIIPLGLARMNLAVGAAILATATIVAVATNHQTINLPDAATTSAYWSVILPPGWGGATIVATVLWAPSTTNTGNARLFVQHFRQVVGPVTLSATASDEEILLEAATGTIDRVQRATFPAMSLAGILDNEGISFRLGRTGADGADTFAGDVRVVGVALSVVG